MKFPFFTAETSAEFAKAETGHTPHILQFTTIVDGRKLLFFFTKIFLIKAMWFFPLYATIWLYIPIKFEN